MKIKTSKGVLDLLMLGLMLLVTSGQSSAQTSTGGTTWTRVGTLPPGTWSLAYDSQAQSAYAFSSEGIVHSSNGSAAWTPCLPEARSMSLLNLLPGQKGTATLFASTPSGLRQSSDNCASWKSVPAQGIDPSGAHIRWIAPYPNNYQVLYAGMDGLGGLYRSTDAGATWQGAQGLPSGGWATALTADPLHPERIFLGLRSISRNHSPAYVYRSTDGGITWRSASLGMDLLPSDGAITGLVWSGDTLLAATSHNGLFKSTNRGDTWLPANLPRRTSVQQRLTVSGAPHESLPMSISSFLSNAEGVLIINTVEGVFQSLDGTRTWEAFGPDTTRGNNVLMAMDVGTSTVLLTGRDTIWSYTIPHGVATLPTAVPAIAAQLPPTPPPAPPLYTATAPPTPTATPTQTPTATPTVVLAQGPHPSDRAQPDDPAVSSYFPQTGHNIRYGFRDYWANNGGVGLFGYPLTEEFVENGVTVQYFERVRLEYREGKIQWGLLGSELTKGQFFRAIPFFPSTDNKAYFGPTQHSASGPFLDYWRNNGGLATFGYPLSESFKQNGLEYQWFERARFEWHPDLPASKRLVLGTIGTEALQKRGWIR